VVILSSVVGQQRLQMIIDAEAVGIGYDLVHAHRLGKTHSHQILGKHDAAAQRRQPDEFLLEILRPPQRQAGPLLDHEGRIQYFGHRREAVVQRGRIDEWLE
jgi:hypothetical protein